MRVALVGFDTEGRASLEYFRGRGDTVVVCDQKADLVVPEGVEAQVGSGYLDRLDEFDLVVRTAGMQPQIILDRYPELGDKLTTHMNEFFKACPTKNIIGVTGTKGKGTTSTLLTKMIEATGRKVFLGGNIGIPPLTFLNELSADSWVVLELSSFMLSDIRYSPPIGVCLMVVPEHLNWHKDMADYMAAKSNLFIHQTSSDIAIYFAGNENSREIAAAGAGRKVPFFVPPEAYALPSAYVNGNMITIDGTEICTTDELKLLGRHNWQNACAALTAYWQVDQDIDAARSVLTTFTGLEHRLEFVKLVDNVKYFDDSFGTTPETAAVAVEAFQQPKVLILGGSTKGADFTQLAVTVAHHNVRQVILIGNPDKPEQPTEAANIEAVLRAQGYDAITSLVRPGGAGMAEIVEAARAAAQPGDAVLLSCGCASFDMFENYKDRGNQFKTAVNALS